jgi:hypothetical protein
MVCFNRVFLLYNIRGIIGNSICSSLQAWKNRFNKNLFKAFSIIYKTEDLWVALDRYGCLRPTIDENGNVKENWKT